MGRDRVGCDECEEVRASESTRGDVAEAGRSWVFAFGFEQSAKLRLCDYSVGEALAVGVLRGVS